MPIYIEDVPDLGRVIVVGKDVFDWGLDTHSIKKAILIHGMDEATYARLIGNIQTHLLTCFSEFIGRKVTLEEIVQALDEGIISVHEENFLE